MSHYQLTIAQIEHFFNSTGMVNQPVYKFTLSVGFVTRIESNLNKQP